MEKIKIDGTCEKGYEKVKKIFEDNFKNGEEENSQLCVYVGGKKVIDLYGTAVGDTNYGPDTLTNMYSSGKSIAAIVVAMLVDQGLLSYDEKIVRYWPEFGNKGKTDITLADVLRHEAGLQDLNHTFKISDFSRDGIKANELGKVIEELEPVFPTKELGVSNPDGTETRRAYHALSRGWVLNEVVRRVDPQNRTIGEIIESDMGIDGVRCGINDEEAKNTGQLSAKSISWLLLQCLTPKAFGGATNMTIFKLGKTMSQKKTEFQKLMEKNVPAFESMPKKFDANKMAVAFNNIEVRKGEMPSANCHGSARGMAELAAIMANKGKRLSSGDGEEDSNKTSSLMSEETWNKMHGAEKVAVDAFMPGALRTNFTQGGVCAFKAESMPDPLTESEKTLINCREGYYGWMGFGGSIFEWHPELNIGFGYVPTNLQWWEFNEMSGRLQQAVVECVKELK